jgi:Ca2+-binding RTX toxin-like protein
MRRTILLLATMALTLLVASGVALAVNKIGTDGPDTLKGTNGDDNLFGKGGDDRLFALGGRDNLLGGPGKDYLFGGDERRLGGGNKNLVGGTGNDVVASGVGSDNAVGGPGNDFLNDVIREAAEDNYVGGPGDDVFAVNNRPAGVERVLADRKDVVAGDCERVYFGLTDEEFAETIPPSFFEGLPPPPEG